MNVLRANLRSSGKRLWAAGAAITISVAFIITGMLLVNSFTQAVEEDAIADMAGTDLVVSTYPLGTSSESDSAFPDEVLAEAIEDLDQVEHAEPLRTTYLQEQNDDGMGWGLSAQQIGQTRSVEVVEGRAPESANEILINESAEQSGTQVGDVFLADADPYGENADADSGTQEDEAAVEYTVVGLADGAGYPSAFMTAEAMEQLPTPADPEAIRVVLTDDAHGNAAAQEAIQQHIAELISTEAQTGDLGISWFQELEAEELQLQEGAFGELNLAGMEILSTQQQIDSSIAQDTGDADLLTYIAYGFGGIAVFVAVLVITNTFQVLVASRQRSMALLRAVGATAAQLRRATVAEGVLLGVAGGVAGVLVGWGLAVVLRLILQTVGHTEIPAVVPSVVAVGTGLGVAVAMTVLATLQPALKAGRVSPMAALRPADVADTGRAPLPWMRLISGTVLGVAGGAAVLFAALYEPTSDEMFTPHVDPWLGMPLPLIGVAGAVLGFLGVLLLARMVIPALVGGLGGLLKRIPGLRITASLAGKNARQVPGRTAATASALLVGVTLVATMTVGAATAQRMLYTELAESYPVDGVVTGTVEARDAVAADELVANSADLPAAQAVLEGESAEQPVSVVALEPGQLDDLAHRTGTEPQSGEVLVPESMSYAESPVMPEEQISLTPTAQQAEAITGQTHAVDWLPDSVVAVNADDLLGAAGVQDLSELQSAEAESAGADQGWALSQAAGITVLRTSEDISEAEVYSLQSLAEGEAGSGEEAGSSSESDFSEAEAEASGGQAVLMGSLMRSAYTQMIDMVLGVVLLLLAAAVVVAVIGVSNTLSLSVFERRREAALLRAVGMSRRGVGQMVSLEALLIAGAALVLGTGLGVFFGWAGVSSLTPRADWSVVVDVPWLRMGLIWAVTLLAAVLAAWLPARELSRVQPAQGLSRD